MDKMCDICGNIMNPVFLGRIMNKYEIQYYQCNNCEYVCTEEPYWLQEAYVDTINYTDTGILRRNLYFSKVSSCLLFFLFSQKEKCLDYGGGYGIMTRLMRDIGFDFFWYDPYTQNIFARGFERYPDKISQKRNIIDLVTSFESFEHFVNPRDDLDKIFNISSNIIFSIELFLSGNLPKPEEWWYYGLEHGQHVSFYSKKTLREIAKKYGVKLYSCGAIHMFTKNKKSNFIFKIVCRLYFFIFPFIRVIMHSKTIDDMNSLKK